MNFLTLVNGLRTFVRSIDFLDISNSAFRIRLTGTATADRVVTLPNDSGTVLLDDRPVGTLGSGVSLRGWEPIVPVPATKTLGLTDAGTVQNCINAAYTIITVPLNSAVAFPIGTRIIIRKTTTLQIDIGFSAGVSILSETGINANADGLTVVGFLILRKTAVDTWIVQNPVPPSINLRGTPTAITQLGSSNSQNIATTAHVKLALTSTPALTGAVLSGTSSVPSGSTLTVPTAALGDVSLNAANTTFVARSCRPIVIASRITAFNFTTTYADLIFDNKIRDSNNAYNATTGVFTAPHAGIYAFTCFVSNLTGLSTFTLVGLGSVANTELIRLGLAAGSGFQASNGRQLVFLNANDTRRFGTQVGAMGAAGTPEVNATAQTSCYMSIEYLGIDT